MEIKILGSCCGKCTELERLARQVVADLGLDASVEKVTDLMEIMSYGIMSTPGLVINGEVRLAGRVPKLDELKSIISAAAWA